MPDAKAVAAMMKYNESLQKAACCSPSMVSRCLASENEVIEIRQVQELADFPPEVQQAAAGFSEMQGKSSRS